MSWSMILPVCLDYCCSCFNEVPCCRKTEFGGESICFAANALASCDVPSTYFCWDVAAPVLLPVSLVVNNTGHRALWPEI